MDRLAELSDLMRLGARAVDGPLQPPLGGFLHRCWTTLTQFCNTHAPVLTDVAHTSVVAGAVPLSILAALVAPSSPVTPAAQSAHVGQQAASARAVPIATLPDQTTVRPSQQPSPVAPFAPPTPATQRDQLGSWPTPSPTSWTWPWSSEGQPDSGPRPGAQESASPQPREKDGWDGGWQPQPPPSEQPTATPSSSPTAAAFPTSFR